MLAKMLKKSITENAFQMITMRPEFYTLYGHESGLLLLKTILDKSPIDSSIDPNVVRKELANAQIKFKELKYDVRELNTWVTLKLTQLAQSGEKSTDTVSHLWTAYMSSNDPEFKDFIIRLHDQVTIYDMQEISTAEIMEKAKKKFDALETRRRLESIEKQKDDELIALQTKIKKFEKRAKPAEQGSPGNAKNGKQKRGGKDRKKKKEYKAKPLPDALKTKPEPNDLTKPFKLDGVNWWFCKKHKWCKHQDSKCKGFDRKTEPAPAQEGGDRANRTIRAVNAIVQATA
jgi:hypothetical protein